MIVVEVKTAETEKNDVKRNKCKQMEMQNFQSTNKKHSNSGFAVSRIQMTTTIIHNHASQSQRPSQTHDILVCDCSSPIQKCCTPPDVHTAHTSAAIVIPRLKNRPGHTIRQGLSIPNLGRTSSMDNVGRISC